jgi:hypothetical protein
MADKKISQLVAATTVNTGDVIPMVQGGQTLKIDASTLFKNIPVRTVVLEAAESVVSGALSTAILTSKVIPSGAPTNYTLASGTHGMEKEIVCETFTSGTAVVAVTNGAGFANLTFDAVGDAIKLKNIGAKWYIMGNNGVVVA